MVMMPPPRVRPKSVKSSIAVGPISIALILMVILTSEVWGHHTMMCYREQSTTLVQEYDKYKNLSGLGTDRVQMITYLGHGPRINVLTYWTDSQIDLVTPVNTPSFGFNFTLYPLYYSNGNHMTGWYRLQVKYWGQRQDWLQTYGSHLLYYILWAQNENYEFIGEWLTDDQFQPVNDPRFKKCPRNDMTRYMGISCGGAYPTQPSVSNTVRFAAHNLRNLAGYLGSSPYFNFSSASYIGSPVHPNNLATMNYYFRLSAQSCDTVKRDTPFRPKVLKTGILFSIKAMPMAPNANAAYDTYTYGGLGFNVHEVMYEVTEPGAILGGADPLDLAKDVNCEKEIKEYDNNQNNTNFTWFAKSFRPRTFDYENDFKAEMSANNDWMLNREFGCQAVLFGGRCKHNMNTPIEPIFYPLRRWPDQLLKQQNIAQPDISYKCNTNVTKYIPLKGATTIDYSDFLAKQSANFMIKCPTVEEQESCSNRKRQIDGKTAIVNPVKEFDKERGLHVKQFNSVWNLRQGHGIIMVILTVFLIPVSAFIARYFKESFMDRRIFYSRIWYAIHSHASGFIFVFTFAGATVAFVSRIALGKSFTKSAKTHHILAYVSYAILVLVFLGSGLRSYDEGGRTFSICFHWALGTIFYLLNIGALLTSMYIPGSPIALIDHSLTLELREKFNLPSGSDFSVVLIIGWIVFDMLAHLVMTIGILMSDKEMQVVESRSYCPSPIPVIREGETASANGSAFRTIMLFLYISVSILVTVGLCYIITFESSPDGRGYGPMSCTHSIAHNVIQSRLPKMRADCKY